MNENEREIYSILKEKENLTIKEISENTLMGSIFDGGFFKLSEKEVKKVIISLKKRGVINEKFRLVK